MLELPLPWAVSSETWVNSRYNFSCCNTGNVYAKILLLFWACKTCLNGNINWMYVPVDNYTLCAEPSSAVNNWYPFPHMKGQRQNRVNFLVKGNNLVSGSSLKPQLWYLKPNELISIFMAPTSFSNVLIIYCLLKCFAKTLCCRNCRKMKKRFIKKWPDKVKQTRSISQLEMTEWTALGSISQ